MAVRLDALMATGLGGSMTVRNARVFGADDARGDVGWVDGRLLDAGALPLMFSILGDLFAPEQRNTMAAIIGTASGLGLIVGQVLAGALSPDWRLPFLIVSVPTMFIGLVTFLSTQEPSRGAAEEALQMMQKAGLEYHTKINFSRLQDILHIPTNLLIFLQAIPGCIPWGMLNTYFNDFMAQDHPDASIASIPVGLWLVERIEAVVQIWGGLGSLL
ncbi:hypothetical protein CYMTET_53060 [Cymbomonas tetramitiformis]|uniref:Uncharacterized protein n=1 Tax=Cymbomonas tetramitiformis TaxID=36881 RepID=A0AAE0EQF5_9CHLO|nr:hypothetical protein CYMTET_53060 [Cymbomonas tetramitiformis]